MATTVKKHINKSIISSKILVIPLILFFIFLFILPLIKLFWISLNQNGSIGAYQYVLSERVFRSVFLNTLILSIESSFIALVICFPIAYMLVNYSKRKSVGIIGFIMLPFWMSILIRSFAWTVILQKEGIVNQFLALVRISKLSLLYNRFSVLVGIIYVFIPYVVLILYNSFKKIDPLLINTGHSLGANKFENFYKIFLPQALNGIIFSILYVFIVSFGYFITPSLLGGAKDTTISMLVDMDMNQTMNWSQGAALSFLILLTILSILLLGVAFLKKESS